MPAARAAKKLDDFVELRGEVAHRGAAAGSITKPVVLDYYNHVKRLVAKTGGRINSHVKKATGVRLF